MMRENINSIGNSSGGSAFNMTPIIDIVFLLIIFFMVVCKFIEAENFEVSVPDNCEYAETSEQDGQETTVTVMKNGDSVEFAVGSEKISAVGGRQIAEKVAELIDKRLENISGDNKVVTLRVDKDIRFGQAQYALCGIGQSIATDVQLSALKQKRTDGQ